MEVQIFHYSLAVNDLIYSTLFSPILIKKEIEVHFLISEPIFVTK